MEIEEKLSEFGIKFACDFAEWTAFRYVRLHGCWVHKYASQTDKSNYLTTSELIQEFLKTYKG
jgi:hypothetical protein